MRRGSHGKAVHRDADGKLIGVNLGADFTSEHEWGISGIREAYGIDDNAIGLDRRLIKNVPGKKLVRGSPNLFVVDYSGKRAKRIKRTWHGLVSSRYETQLGADITPDSIVRCELQPFGSETFFGAWDDGSFGFLSAEGDVVDEIWDAIHAKNLCIGLFNPIGQNPFSRSGLGLLIASRIPSPVVQLWVDSDTDAKRLESESAATGIAQRLENAGLRYFALRPRWRSNDDGRSTAHPVIYWLNPMNQDENDYGWFTVEELDQWIYGRGPVVKTAASGAGRS